VKETLASSKKDASSALPAEELKPQGIGMAVAFDWGLTVQLLSMPFLSLLLGNAGPFTFFHQSPLVTTLLAFVASLPFAALLAVFGEGVRRGWNWTRPVQVVFNALLFIGGLAGLPNLWQSVTHGNYWPLVTSVILVIFSPLIAWRLSRPQTAQWFKTVSSAAARKRHGGAWPYLIAIWAIVGGILQALTVIKP
jgi:ACR3 family arsenite efflux pump ArsB